VLEQSPTSPSSEESVVDIAQKYGLDDDVPSSRGTAARGGGGIQQQQPSSTVTRPHRPPSFYWAVLANWLYCVSLCFNAINIQYLIRQIVDGEITSSPSAEAIALSGKVESVDKFLTFAGIGFLSSLSDKYGRKPLLAWSALGFCVTNLVQASTKRSVAMLYLADFVDGCSSCMTPLCVSKY